MKKKIVYLLLLLLLLFCLSVPSVAMSSEVSVQLVHIEKGSSFNVQTAVYFRMLEQAVENAVSGDVIELFADVTVSSPITIPAGTELTVVSGEKRENTAVFGSSSFESTNPDALTRLVTKDFDGSLFILSENSNVTFMNLILDGNGKGGEKGGLIYVKSGASLSLKHGDCHSGVSLINSALGQGSKGGAVYAEKGSHVLIGDTSFRNNSAGTENDIFAEASGDVTRKQESDEAEGPKPTVPSGNETGIHPDKVRRTKGIITYCVILLFGAAGVILLSVAGKKRSD